MNFFGIEKSSREAFKKWEVRQESELRDSEGITNICHKRALEKKML
jgi:hypothetical protein